MIDAPGPCAGGDTTCGRCGYPARRPPTPPEQKIRIRLDDEHARKIWETAKRAAAEVAMWPAWKANECRCTPEELSAFMAEILNDHVREIDPAARDFEKYVAKTRELIGPRPMANPALSDVQAAIEAMNQRIASAYALPAHLLDPNAPAPCVELTITPKCYGCGAALDWIPTAQPALCGDCDNVP